MFADSFSVLSIHCTVIHCDCGQRQTMNSIVGTCPLRKFERRELNLLHEADDDAVIWLESTATSALAK